MSLRLAYVMNMRMPTEKAHGVQVMKMCESFAQSVSVRLYVSRRRTTISTDPYQYYGVPPTFRISRIFSFDLVRYGFLGFYLQAITFRISMLGVLLWARPDAVYTRDPWITFISRLCFIRNIGWEVHVAPSWWTCRLGGMGATTIISITGGLKDHLVHKGVDPAKIRVEHDGVDVDEFTRLPSREVVRTALSLPQDRIIVSYVGKLTTMGERKGVEEIIQAVGQLKREIPELFMLIVGVNEAEQEEAEWLVSAAGLAEGDALLVPHILRTRIPLYLRSSSVLVMNYPNTSHYAHIMSPLKLFEYMASKTPIVSSDLPSIREVVDDTSAFLVEPDSPAALREGIRAAVAYSNDATRRAERAFQLVQGYTWSARARRILTSLGDSNASLREPYSQVDSNNHG